MSFRPPALSILIPWCNRAELRQTLHHNRGAFISADCEVIIINCGGCLRDLQEILAAVQYLPWRLINLPHASFNKSLSINIGAEAATASAMMVLDCDILVQPTLLRNLHERLTQGGFVSVEWMRESALAMATESESQSQNTLTRVVRTDIMEFAFPNNQTRRIATYRYNLLDQSRSGLSLLLVSKEDFVAVGGYHSAIETWGWEDNDFQLRLQWGRGLTLTEFGSVTHLTHDDTSRALFGRSQLEAVNVNLLSCVQRYERGDLCGTYNTDTETWVGCTQEWLPSSRVDQKLSAARSVALRSDCPKDTKR